MSVIHFFGHLRNRLRDCLLASESGVSHVEKGRATIKDVARLAGVSTATVSHVLNRTRFVSEGATQRVLDAMKETRYSSNYIAKALRSNKTHTIGVVIPDLSNPFFSNILFHMEPILQQAGYMMILCDSHENHKREEEMIRRLCGFQVDAIMLTPVSPRVDYVQLAEQLDCPMVFMDRHPNSKNYHGVFCTARNRVAEAVEMMIRSGHDCVALINRDTSGIYSVVREREEGYRDALLRNNIQPDPRYIFSVPGSIEHGYVKMADILRDMPEVNGVFCANRLLSLGALQCLIDNGKRIPEEMSIVGFSTHNWHNVTTPRLSSVLEPLKAMGEETAKLLLKVLENPALPPQQVVLTAELIGNASIVRSSIQ